MDQFVLISKLINKRNNTGRSVLFCFVLLVFLTTFSNAVFAQEKYPTKPITYIVGYPPIKYSIIIPFFNAVPRWSILYFGIIIYSTVKIILTCNGDLDKSKFLLNIIYICVVITSIFRLQESTTRYSFFFFPMVLALGYFELKEIFTKIQWPILQKYRSLSFTFIFSIPFVLFMFTEDFHINHILDVSSCEANYRIGKYSRFDDHWFERFDNKTPAQYVNMNFRKGDVVMIDSIVVSEYLNERPYFQCNINSMWFDQFSRKFGTKFHN